MISKVQGDLHALPMSFHKLPNRPPCTGTSKFTELQQQSRNNDQHRFVLEPIEHFPQLKHQLGTDEKKHWNRKHAKHES